MAEQLRDTTDIEPALIVGSSDQLRWDEEADLVVVGFGGSGASAALEGAERGANVIVIDRFDGGGATAYSGGIFYASNTSIQKEAGVTDSAEEMRKYLSAEKAPVEDATLRRFCEGSAADFAWVSRHVPYSAALYTGKATYPPEGKFLYYCGNEKLEVFSAVARPAPRGHRAVGTGYTGHVFYAGLRKAALEAGVKLMAHAPVRRLVMDEQGSVLGVEVQQLPPEVIEAHVKLYKQVNPHVPMIGKKAEKAIAELRAFEKTHGTRRLVRARGGVVLAAGGFAYNLKLLQRHRPDLASAYAEIMRLGTPGCDGSGMALGESAGGYVDLMSNAFVGKTISPPEPYLHGVLINREGRRFINEDAYIGVVGGAIAEQSDNGAAWLVVDGSTFWKGFWAAVTIGRGMFYFWGLPALMNVFLGGTRRGATLQALARKCRMDGTALEETIRTYNDRIASNAPDDQGKLAANIAPIGGGPYYAINMSIRNKFGMTPVFTLGGLRVEEVTGGVARQDGSVVRGLYAAGRTAVGLCSAGYMSGMSLADLVFSGRRAAAAAVAAINDRRVGGKSASGGA
jgi:3-oxo-5alpha-steroid 4-dehydrogenase